MIRGINYVQWRNTRKHNNGNIKRIRKEHNLTQVQLVDLIQYNEGTIANIENSSYQTFSLEFLYIISKKLNVPMSEFFKNDE